MGGHRGPHPKDDTLFADDERPTLRRAVYDLSWLRSRGYGDQGALKLVGDRYRLQRRQRDAVARSACSDAELRHRRQALTRKADGQPVYLDGFNQTILAEGALGGAYLFIGRDGAYRDVQSVRGTYRLVEETRPALQMIGRALRAGGASAAVWLLDEHVSNTGRLKAEIRTVADTLTDQEWTVRVGRGVDQALTDAAGPVATSDSRVLGQCRSWINLLADVCALVREADAQGQTEAPNVCDLRPRTS